MLLFKQCWEVNSYVLTFLEVGFGGNSVQGFRAYTWRAVPSFSQIALCFPSLALRPQPFQFRDCLILKLRRKMAVDAGGLELYWEQMIKSIILRWRGSRGQKVISRHFDQMSLGLLLLLRTCINPTSPTNHPSPSTQRPTIGKRRQLVLIAEGG